MAAGQKEDYYELLGVAKTATEDELKKAYRKKAVQFHPDKNPGNKEAEEMFKKISEAYEALKDPDKRAAYEESIRIPMLLRLPGRINAGLAPTQFVDHCDLFQTVLDLDDKHSQNEILREIGGLYLAARQYEHARRELASYIQRRPYDPEGLCYYGQALERLGDAAGAREMYARSIEAARTAPPYLRRETAKWSRLSQKYARKLA